MKKIIIFLAATFCFSANSLEIKTVSLTSGMVTHYSFTHRGGTVISLLALPSMANIVLRLFRGDELIDEQPASTSTLTIYEGEYLEIDCTKYELEASGSLFITPLVEME